MNLFEPEKAQKFKEEGNTFFNNKNFAEAIKSYSAAIDLKHWPPTETQLRAVCLTNRAACYLQLGSKDDLMNAVQDCTEALSLHSNHGKALYRRAQAFEALGNFADAFKDARELVRIEPTNKTAVAMANKLMTNLKQSESETLSTDNVNGLLNTLGDVSKESKHDEAIVKLVISSKEPEKAASIIKYHGIDILYNLIYGESSNNNSAPHKKMQIGALKILVNIAHAKKEYSSLILQKISMEYLLQLCRDKEGDILCNGISLTAAIISNMDDNETTQNYHRKFVETCVELIRKRETPIKVYAMNELIKLKWSKFDINLFVQEFTGDIFSVSVTEDIRQLLSVLLSKLFQASGTDEIQMFKTEALKAIKNYTKSQVVSDNMIGLCALSSILLADAEIGVDLFLKDIMGFVEVVDTLKSDDESQEQALLIASEILSLASGHKSFQKVCEPNVFTELISLFESNNTEVSARIAAVKSKLAQGNEKIRELVMQDNGKDQLDVIFAALQKILNNNTKPSSSSEATATWAMEALTFLCFQPSVKEVIINNDTMLSTLISLFKKEHSQLWYGLISVFGNLARYPARVDEVEKLKEQLSKFATGEKQADSDKPDPLDDIPAVDKRTAILVNKGLAKYLSNVVSDSQKPATGESSTGVVTTDISREAIAQLFLDLATNQKNRGKLVQDGAMKALLALESHGSPKVKNIASHAIAKIAISVDPRVGYSEGVATRMIDPLKSLFTSEDGLQQFESLMALTNLTMFGEETIQLILKNSGLHHIELMLVSNNELIQRATVELLCNLMMYSDVVESYRPSSGTNLEVIERRLKIFAAFATADDRPTAIAASGALAMLSGDEEVCRHMITILNAETFLSLALTDDPELNHRAMVVLNNCVELKDESYLQLLKDKKAGLVFAKVANSSPHPTARELAASALTTLVGK